ncbi:hypothetical protein MKX08_010054 [Trichoderma sp. CBMAI-0020]|nr:hypothetical protein MKX08_010054 [Trichoderma sp. CBMAI-0020]
MSEPVKDNTPVQDGKYYLLSLSDGGVVSAIEDQWGPDSVRIRVFENTHRANEAQGIAASANALDDWERFFLADTSDRKIFSLIFNGRKEYVFYREETDFLVISDQAAVATPITIEELEE